MKNILSYIVLALATVLAGCNLKQDAIFDQTPDERIQSVMDHYTTALLSSPNGWFMAIETGVDGGYLLWMSFTENGRVVMLSDMEATWPQNGAVASIPKESSYRLKCQQMPSLIFDTYSYLHMMADPQGTNASYGDINGGVNGVGLASDFEFDILSYDNGRFNLRGKYNRRPAYLFPTSADEAAAAADGGLKTIHEKMSAYFKTMKVPAVEVLDTKVQVNIDNRQVMFSYVDWDNSLVEESFGFYLDMDCMTSSQAVSNLHFFNKRSSIDIVPKGIEWIDGKYYLVTDSGNAEIFDNLVPPMALSLGHLKTYSQLNFTTYADFQGTMSQKYYTDLFLPAYTTHSDTGRSITYLNCTFKMGSSGVPQMEVKMGSLTRSTGVTYIAMWNLDYTTNSDGTITFTDRTETNGNAQSYGRYMRGLLDIFTTIPYTTYSYASSKYTIVKDTENMVPHTFKIDWVENNSPALGGKKIGGLVRVDDPELYFCGVLAQ